MAKLRHMQKKLTSKDARYLPFFKFVRYFLAKLTAVVDDPNLLVLWAYGCFLHPGQRHLV